MQGFLRSAGVVAVAGVFLLAAGCSGGDNSSAGSKPPVAQRGTSAQATGAPGGPSTPTRAPNADTQAAEAKRKLLACLSKQGINGVPSDLSKLPTDRRLAVQQCGMAALTDASTAAKKQAEALRACMEKQGIKVPPAGQGYVPDVRDPKAVAALKTCQSQLTPGN